MQSIATQQNRLISHGGTEEALEAIIEKIAARITAAGDQPGASVSQQLTLLTELSQFDFGRYLLQNQGINGYWTHYMVMHPRFGKHTGKNNRGEDFSPLERFILERAPTMLATQQRFEIFLRENQNQVKPHAKLASIPSGMMGELFYLNYEAAKNVELIGMDYDPDALKNAAALAEEMGMADKVRCIQQDAWQLEFENELDLISSNGLTIYEPDDEKVTALYRHFYKALKPGGQLVTSFLTPPPTVTDQCEWDFAHINQADLLLQKTIFVDIIQAKCLCYRSSDQVRTQLESVGFKDVRFIYDQAKLFSTVVAYKDF